ncbi:MAG: hypothetical protein IT260_08590 [Saprospiraceae bacterium]|nr:hypothetical protein [Saprospiraceae bacterium]
MAASEPLKSSQNIRFEIPEFHEFGEILHDRLHAVLYHVEEWESKFMLITNLFDRDPDRIRQLREQQAEDLEVLHYSGTKMQRQILEKDAPEYYINANHGAWDPLAWREERTQNWEVLHNRHLTRESETFGVFSLFREGTLGVENIQVSSLADYFNSTAMSVVQQNEQPIIGDYFELATDKYIGIPLMGMGLFQGIVWIVFKDEEKKRFKKNRYIRRLIKQFQMEYDNLALSWDVKGVNIQKRSLINENIKAVNPTNAIQEECNLIKFYSISERYYDERIKQNDAVADKIKGQYLKTATITILLDSFAHNISAHSLTTLSWWFRERAEYFEEKGKQFIEAMGRDENPLIRHSKLTDKASLSREMFPLFKFLLEKGAFWSGITRQTNFTGKISSLYSVLWYDFANNPLYLGTIANTEEVRKLYINITIYEKEERPETENFKNTKIIKRGANGQLLDGSFAVVNLDDFSLKNQQAQRSIFVEEGQLYAALRPELESIRAFFPGGVVGKHAFFTLLENEIRNVKHFKDATLRAIQREGLVLNISIHERPVDSNKPAPTSSYELLKIGVWLGHPVKDGLTADLLLKRIEGLDKEIVTEDSFQPRLGGNYQDKLCASMLLTNTFDRVQEKDSSLGKIYYPWLKTAGYKIREDDQAQRLEFEVSQRKYKDVTDEDLSLDFLSEAGEGYLKKYFHLWKGADIISIDGSKDLAHTEMENLARFRFLHIADPAQYAPHIYKQEGIIRILQGHSKPGDVAEAYQRWLPIWLKKDKRNQDVAYTFVEGDSIAGRITFEAGCVRFESVDQVRDADNDDERFARFKAIPTRIEIAIEHGAHMTVEPDKFNYRSHGEFISRFCQGDHLYNLKTMDLADTYDLLEALCTRICIFDRRSYSRMYLGEETSGTQPETDPAKKELQLARLELYREKLFIDFRSENLEHWHTVQQAGFQHFHFLILHLSFIESMKDAKDNSYSEERILDFIDDQILQGAPPESVGDDFILVITTGRGRMAWWDKVKSDSQYARFTTFRPIESILGAVEDALQMPDDIDLKYNLTKLLFGS